MVPGSMNESSVAEWKVQWKLGGKETVLNGTRPNDWSTHCATGAPRCCWAMPSMDGNC